MEQSLRAPGGGYSRDMRTKRTLEDIRREQGFLRRRAESRASRSQSTVSMGSASLAASSALLHNGFGQPQTVRSLLAAPMGVGWIVVAGYSLCLTAMRPHLKRSVMPSNCQLSPQTSS